MFGSQFICYRDLGFSTTNKQELENDNNGELKIGYGLWKDISQLPTVSSAFIEVELAERPSVWDVWGADRPFSGSRHIWAGKRIFVIGYSGLLSQTLRSS